MRRLLLCRVLRMHTFEVKIQDSDQTLLHCTRCGGERPYDGPEPSAPTGSVQPPFPVT
jgi:hypothetical protein